MVGGVGGTPTAPHRRRCDAPKIRRPATEIDTKGLVTRILFRAPGNSKSMTPPRPSPSSICVFKSFLAAFALAACANSEPSGNETGTAGTSGGTRRDDRAAEWIDRRDGTGSGHGRNPRQWRQQRQAGKGGTTGSGGVGERVSRHHGRGGLDRHGHGGHDGYRGRRRAARARPGSPGVAARRAARARPGWPGAAARRAARARPGWPGAAARRAAARRRGGRGGTTGRWRRRDRLGRHHRHRRRGGGRLQRGSPVRRHGAQLVECSGHRGRPELVDLDELGSGDHHHLQRSGVQRLLEQLRRLPGPHRPAVREQRQGGQRTGNGHGPVHRDKNGIRRRLLVCRNLRLVGEPVHRVVHRR